MEPPTLVNSAVNSTIDLQSQENEAIESTLYKHPVYQYYEQLNSEHAIKNSESGAIQENIWPQLTGHTLVGQGKINLRSKGLYIIDNDFLTKYEDIHQLDEHQKNYSYTFFHLGHKLSGHAQIIHGGLLATILDELTCRLAFQNFELKKGVTANLNINYFKPCYVDLYVMIKCTVLKKTGRKCHVKGQVFQLNLDEEIEGDVRESVESKANLLTECECLVIEPKWVHKLNNTAS